MPAKIYYCMLQGGTPALLEKVVKLLPKGEVLWAGLGDALIEPTRILPPHHRTVRSSRIRKCLP